MALKPVWSSLKVWGEILLEFKSETSDVQNFGRAYAAIPSVNCSVGKVKPFWFKNCEPSFRPKIFSTQCIFRKQRSFCPFCKPIKQSRLPFLGRCLATHFRFWLFSLFWFMECHWRPSTWNHAEYFKTLPSAGMATVRCTSLTLQMESKRLTVV